MSKQMVALVVIACGIFFEAWSQDSAEKLPRLESYCSNVEPGVSVAEVQWAPGATAAADLAKVVSAQVLDITVYKDGFNRGLYKTVKPGTQDREFRLFKPQPREIPGLRTLRLTQFATSQQKPQEGLRLMMRPLPGQQSAYAKLEGLEPGMRYFIRISSPESTPQKVSFVAPICPVDKVRR